jgi:hypothetical protein
METLKFAIVAGLALATVIGIFAMLILLFNIVKELRKKGKAEGGAVAPIVQVVTPSVSAPVAPSEEKAVEPVIVPSVEQTEVEEKVEEAVATEDTVTFSSDKTLTIDDKYLELDGSNKGYYDEIIAYATKVEGSRRFKNARYEEYKVGKNRLVRMLIKRGVVVCEFILPNNDFKNYVSENKLKIKAAPTVLKITDAESVQVAKDSIDIAIKAIEEEKEYKRQQTRERRKQARIAKQG